MKLRHFTVLFGMLACMGGTVKAQAYSLDSCLELALRNDATIKNARIDMQMAEEDSKYAFSKYFPNITLNGAGFIAAKQLLSTEIPLVSLSGTSTMPVSGRTYSTSVDAKYNLNIIRQGAIGTISAIQPVFAGGQIVNGNKLAALQKEVRSLQYGMTCDQILQSVEDYYWQMVSVHSNIRSLDAAEELLDSLEEVVEKFYTAGFATKSDVLAVDLKKQETASLRIKVENGLELLRLVLAQLTGSSLDSFSVEIPDSLSSPDSPETWFMEPADAALSRQELTLADKAVKAEELQTKVERGKLMPTIGVGAIALGSYIDLQGGFEENKTANVIGLATVSIPLTDWWGGTHTVRKAKLSQAKAQNVRDDAYSQLQMDIRSSWNSLTEAWAQIDIARKSLESATENLRMIREQFYVGVETTATMLEAVMTYTQAQANLTASQATYMSCLSAYRRKTVQEQ